MSNKREYTLEYWLDDGWYVGRLKEVPGVFSQGKTLEELIENIRDAFALMMEEAAEETAALHVTPREVVVEL